MIDNIRKKNGFPLTEKQLDMIADKVYNRLVENRKLAMQSSKAGTGDMLTSKEAARMLGMTSTYLLSIKDQFRYVKTGDNQQSRVLFYKEDILDKISSYKK